MENLYGYYIHGRSPHGLADIDMKGMIMNLQREEENLIGQRGLEPNSKDQIFILKISQRFRSEFDNLINNYRVGVAENDVDRSRDSVFFLTI